MSGWGYERELSHLAQMVAPHYEELGKRRVREIVLLVMETFSELPSSRGFASVCW